MIVDKIEAHADRVDRVTLRHMTAGKQRNQPRLACVGLSRDRPRLQLAVEYFYQFFLWFLAQCRVGVYEDLPAFAIKQLHDGSHFDDQDLLLDGVVLIISEQFFDVLKDSICTLLEFSALALCILTLHKGTASVADPGENLRIKG